VVTTVARPGAPGLNPLADTTVTGVHRRPGQTLTPTLTGGHRTVGSTVG
jgi:hypothetical protein